MTQNHFLIVNPSEMVLRLVKSGVETKNGERFDITIVTTPDYQAQLPDALEFEKIYNAKLVDLRSGKATWDSEAKFTSGIAYNLTGQSFIEDHQSQFILNNVEFSTTRLENYYKDKPQAGDFIVESLSYNGRHVIVQCIKFDDGVKVENELGTERWANIAEMVTAFLDDHKVINGPSQVYFGPTNKINGLRLHPCNISYVEQLKSTSRHWWDVWPTVTMLHKDKPNQAFRKFYEWTEKTGKTSKIYNPGNEGEQDLKT